MSTNAPDAPNVNNQIAAQTGANFGVTAANNKAGYVGQTTPYGSVSLQKTGNVKYKDPVTGKKYKLPTFNEVVTLTDEGQKQFDLRQSTISNILNTANTAASNLNGVLGSAVKFGDFNYGADLGVGAYQPGQSLDGEAYANDTPLTLGNEATEARLFELGSKRLDPRFAQQRDSLQSSLMARGIREGTAAWDAAMRNFNEGQNDAYNQLLLTGRGQAANEMMAEWQAGLTGQNQRFNQLVQSRGLGMAEQGQQFNQALADRERLLAEQGQQSREILAARSQPINEIAALLGAGQVGIPELQGYRPSGAPITDIAGLMNTNYNQQLQEWQAESNATNNLLGGIMGAAGNIFMSDRRIKDNVAPVGETETGLPIYEFTIGDGPTQTGVLAQDVEDVNPDAVIETPSGIKAVDYAAAVGDGTGTYTVQRGDTLWDIGQRFGVPYEEIAALNNISNPDAISAGSELIIPGLAAPGPEAIPLGEAMAGGMGGDLMAGPVDGMGGQEAVAAALGGAEDPTFSNIESKLLADDEMWKRWRNEQHQTPYRYPAAPQPDPGMEQMMIDAFQRRQLMGGFGMPSSMGGF